MSAPHVIKLKCRPAINRRGWAVTVMAHEEPDPDADEVGEEWFPLDQFREYREALGVCVGKLSSGLHGDRPHFVRRRLDTAIHKAVEGYAVFLALQFKKKAFAEVREQGSVEVELP